MNAWGEGWTEVWLYLSLTSALDGGVNAKPLPSYLRKDPVPIVQETGWAPGPVWAGAENLATTGVRTTTV